MFYQPTFKFLLAGIILFNTCWMTSCQTATSKENTEQNKTDNREIPELMARKANLGSADEQSFMLNTFTTLKDKALKNPNDLTSRLKIAELYVLEARTTGEFGYYYDAALNILDDVLAKAPDNKGISFSALSLKASIYLSLHKFEKALKLGEQAVQLNGHNAQIYGILVDAHVELGQYDKAVAMSDKMIQIRPDLRSYSRVSYLREIHGDVDGAIEAMKLAVSAGYPGYEETAWCRYTLGKLYESYGDLPNAEMQYKIVLEERAGYPYALAGLASIETKKENYSEALALLNKATISMDNPEFYEQVAEIHILIGDEEQAKTSVSKAIEKLKGLNHDEDAHGHGHSHETGLEMAALYLDLKNDADEAIHLAGHEYDHRPDNIDINRVLAKAYYLKKDYTKAEKHSNKALATGSIHPEALCIDGLIQIELGNKTEGMDLLSKSMEANPFQKGPLAKLAQEHLEG